MFLREQGNTNKVGIKKPTNIRNICSTDCENGKVTTFLIVGGDLV